MVSYESALKKAKQLKKNIDHCMEYERAYSFSSKEDEFSFGGDGPVVILKENGEAINFVSFVGSEDDTGYPINERDL